MANRRNEVNWTCFQCRGNGWYNRDTGYEINVPTNCDLCGGTGRCPGRHCRDCDKDLPLSDFYVNLRKGVPYYKSYCKECSDLRKRLQYYGLTPVDYFSMLEAQGGRCAMCGNVPGEGLQVDHDHATSKVRGLLCRKCNVGLSYFESESFMKNAGDYLKV